MRKLAATGTVAAITLVAVLVAGGAAADTFAVRLISQTKSTVTLGWEPRPGYGYLFSSAGVLRSRTNDAKRSTVRFSKGLAPYEVAVIVKGATGTYPVIEPAKVQCNDRVDNDGDGKTDYPADPDCASSGDKSESGSTQPPPPPPPPTDTTPTTPPPPPPPPTGFPDAASTGVPAGTVLTPYSGPSNVTAANTVIVGKTIGCISVATTGVIIRNSRITCGSGYAAYVDDRFTTQTALTIEDSEISCSDAPGSAGIGEADITARRVEITHCENGADMNQNILIEDSFIHDLYNGGASHADGVQVALGHWNGSGFVCCGLNITLRHNTIYGMGDGDTTFGTSAIITTSTDTNVLITGNVLAGGAYTLYCNRPGKGVNFVVTNNRFSQRFKQTVGFYGPVTDCQDETASGNAYLESGLPVPGIG